MLLAAALAAVQQQNTTFTMHVITAKLLLPARSTACTGRPYHVMPLAAVVSAAVTGCTLGCCWCKLLHSSEYHSRCHCLCCRCSALRRVGDCYCCCSLVYSYLLPFLALIAASWCNLQRFKIAIVNLAVNIGVKPSGAACWTACLKFACVCPENKLA